MIRLFAAIPLDEAARNHISAGVAVLVRSGVRARWVPAENWHVTLAFLGSVAEVRVAAIGAAFRAVAAACVPFGLRLSAIGAFPDQRRPRVLWIGGRDQPFEFGAAAAALRGAFVSLGFRFDDEAVAHVTVGRTDGSVPFELPQIDRELTMPVTRLVLYESVSGHAGVRYVERESVVIGTAS